MNAIDQQLFWSMNRDWTSPLFDWLMPVLSAIDVWLPILGVALVVIAWRGGPRARVMLMTLMLALVLSDAVLGNGLKKLFQRPRPRDAMSGVMIRDVAKAKPRVLALFNPTVTTISNVDKPATSGNSLPSNHTMNLFAVATVIALFYRRWGVAMYVLAGAVAWSRVYVGAHWPSDLAPSAALGVVVGIVAAWTVQRVRECSRHRSA